MSKFLYVLLFVSCLASADGKPYQVNFGMVLKNELGEPIGFEETTQIPKGMNNQTTLYGVVVTVADDKPFTLGTVHVIPAKTSDTKPTKIMGKPMRSLNRGAVFMQTGQQDVAGIYSMEIYLDSQLVQTIEYQLVDAETQETPEKTIPTSNESVEVAIVRQ